MTQSLAQPTRTKHRCWVYGDNVNTDVIFPGKYTYTLQTQDDIRAHALEDLDPAFASGVQSGDVIIAGLNWGCGSSREQAVTAIKWSGVSIIIAASFSGLYFRNCINQGVHPIVCPILHTLITTGATIEIDHGARTIQYGEHIFPIPALSPSVQAILNAGGLTPMLRARFEGEGTTR